MTAETIKQISKNALKPLAHVSEVGAKTVNEFIIDCSTLEDYNNSDIRQAPNFKSLFEKIEKITGPAVYYFEIVSKHEPNDIVKSFEVYSTTPNSKTTPPVNRDFASSKILYVGKAKKNMWGRLIQHLGYYKVNRTQGLQLYYWARHIPLTLRLVVFEFEPEMSNLIGLLEFDMALQVNPILGMHK